MIPFNQTPYIGKELEYIGEAILNRKISGDGPFTKKCNKWLEDYYSVPRVLLTTSCTHATEMTALLIDIKEGDEVIMPSFTFVSTASAFALRGAKVVFVDIRPDTMNINEKLIEEAVSNRTKAIVPVHYAGVGCEMDTIMEIADRKRLIVVEDAAQGITSTYRGKYLGTIGEFGCLSFHETKNLSMGEGGALILRDAVYAERAEIIREKGTDRNKFFRGEIDKYTWVDAGSSYLPSELNAAYLYAQFEAVDKIMVDRKKSWSRYKEALSILAVKGRIELPHIPKECEHNAHMFWIKTRNLKERNALISYLKEKGISAVFHYIPLHTSPAGVRYGEFRGNDIYTTRESERLLRLPLYYGMDKNAVDKVVSVIMDFYQTN